MRILVACSQQSAAGELRDFLLRGNHCSEARVVPPDRIVDAAVQDRPEAVLLRLEEPEKILPLVHQIREAASTRIVLLGPTIEAKVILRLLREGVEEYIDQDDAWDALGPALAKLRGEAAPGGAAGRVLAVLGAGGGCGATTVAVNVAAALAELQHRCVLLDLQLQAADAATLLDLRPGHSLADFCRHANRMDKALFESCLTRHKSGLAVLAAPARYQDVALVTPQGVGRALSMARNLFAYVVLDYALAFQPEDARILAQADPVLLVTRLDFTSVRKAQRVQDFLRDAKIAPERVQLVVNLFRRPGELRVADVEKTLGMCATQIIPEDSRYLIGANNRGVPAVLDNPRAAASKVLLQLAASLNGQASQPTPVSALARLKETLKHALES